MRIGDGVHASVAEGTVRDTTRRDARLRSLTRSFGHSFVRSLACSFVRVESSRERSCVALRVVLRCRFAGRCATPMRRLAPLWWGGVVCTT